MLQVPSQLTSTRSRGLSVCQSVYLSVHHWSLFDFFWFCSSFQKGLVHYWVVSCGFVLLLFLWLLVIFFHNSRLFHIGFNGRHTPLPQVCTSMIFHGNPRGLQYSLRAPTLPKFRHIEYHLSVQQTGRMPENFDNYGNDKISIIYKSIIGGTPELNEGMGNNMEIRVTEHPAIHLQ